MAPPIASSPMTTSSAVSQWAARDVTVMNGFGSHIWPASELYRLARRFKSAARLVVAGQSYEAGKIIEILSADLRHGTKLTLIAEGEDAGDAVAALAQFFERPHANPSEPFRQPFRRGRRRRRPLAL